MLLGKTNYGDDYDFALAQDDTPFLEREVLSKEWFDGADELLDSSFDAGRYVDNFNAESVSRNKVIDARIKAIHAATGEQLHNPYYESYSDFQNRMNAGEDPSKNKFSQLIETFDADLKGLAVKYPQHAKTILGDKSNIEEGLDVSRDAQARFDKAIKNPELGTAARVGISIAGFLGAATRDPIQVATAFAGAGAGTGANVAVRIAKVMAIDGIISAAVEVPLQIKAQAYRKKIGIKSGFEDGLKNVGIAALFGAGIGGAVQGAREVVGAIRAKTGRSLSPEGERALERAFADELLPEDEKALTGELSVFLDRPLDKREKETISQAFERDAMDNSYLEQSGSTFVLPAAANGARRELSEAALRYADDPDNNLPPEILERQLADESGEPKFLTAEDYINYYGLGEELDPVAKAVDIEQAKFINQDPQQYVPVDLNAEQIAAVKRYSTVHSSVINEFLRTGKYPKRGTDLTADTKAINVISDNIVEQGLPKLYRAVEQDDLVKMSNKKINELRPGDVLTDSAFQSTSSDRKISNQHLNAKKHSKNSSATIEIEAGLNKALKVDSSAEREFILPANSRLEVISISSDANGFPIIKSKIIRDSFDPLEGQTLRPPEAVEYVPPAPKRLNDETAPEEVDLFDFGDIDAELKASIDDARAKAGDIGNTDGMDFADMIAVPDGDGKVKYVTAKQALNDARGSADMADVLEACNL